MSLEMLLRSQAPASIAVVGGSDRPGTVGHAVLLNIAAGGCAGEIIAINPHPVVMAGVTWKARIAGLAAAPELALIVCPSGAVMDAVDQLGRMGTRAAIVLSRVDDDASARAALVTVARKHDMRLIGPNSLGVLLPRARLNASFANRIAGEGRLAFLSQSGALITAMLDWADARGFGFSGVVSVGDMADTDFADLIDLYAADPATSAILLYVEGVTSAAKFLSAARAATLIKPVIAIKAGRSVAAGSAAFSHTGALAGTYDIHAAAFRRAGVVLVDSMTDLLDAAQVLSRYRPSKGNRVAIVTNGGGAGVAAADALPAAGLALATLTPHTVTTLDAKLPRGWSRGNPIDIIGDAHADRLEHAMAAALADPTVDSVIVAYCATAVEPAPAMAAAAVRAAAGAAKPVLACWLGPENAASVRSTFIAAGIPLFDSVEDAVRALGYLRRAAEGRAAALRTPPRLSIPSHDSDTARAIIASARAAGRTTLSTVEARALIAAYGIPTVTGRLAATVERLPAACEGVQPPYVLKLTSPDGLHKADVGGVVTGLTDVAGVIAAARAMEGRLTRDHPEIRREGFEVEPMMVERDGLELLVGVADDPVFGPVIAVGAGGKSVEVVADRAFELPPLDDTLARAMIGRTRVAALLGGYRDVPPRHVDGVVAVLEAVATMIADLPDVLELDINPLLVGASRVTALDVRMRIAPHPCARRMAIRPMPVEWAADLTTRSGLLLHVRPVQCDDEELLADLFHRVSPEDLRFRFLTGLREVGRDRLVAMTQIDYARSMHFLAFVEGRLIASAMLSGDPSRRKAEVALAVDLSFKDRGVSWTLLQHVIAYARAEGYEYIESVESTANSAALGLEREMGFDVVGGDGSERIMRRPVNV